MTSQSGTTGRHSTQPRMYSSDVYTGLCLTGMTLSNDYGNDLRQGNRVVSIGEKPYFDPKSRSRREALRLPKVGF